MKNRQPYPFAGVKGLDSYLDGILEAYSQDVESVGNRVETLLNVVGDMPETASGVAEAIVAASEVFAAKGKTVLSVVFDGASRIVSEIPAAAGRTAFFCHDMVDKPLQIAEDITIQDVWEWIKAINRISVLSPEFIPDDIRDGNPAKVLQIPVDGTIDYDFHNVTDIDRLDLPSMIPSTRLYPGNIIDYAPYGISGYALITCCHTQTQEVVSVTPDYYHYDESLWDLSDVAELVPFVSPYSPVSPLVKDIKGGGIRCFWTDYARREMVIQDSIRVFSRKTKQANGNEFSQAFLHYEKRLYTPSSVLYTTDFKSSDSGTQDLTSYTVQESTIERTYGLMCHGVFMPERFYSTLRPHKASFPFIPLIFVGGLMLYPPVINSLISAITTLTASVWLNEVGRDHE